MNANAMYRFLMLVALAAPAALSAQQGPPPGVPQGPPPGAPMTHTDTFIIPIVPQLVLQYAKEIDLSKEQEEKMNALIQAMDKEMKPFNDAMQKRVEPLMTVLQLPPEKRTKEQEESIRKAMMEPQEVSEKRNAVMTSKIEATEKVLTEKQKSKLREIVKAEALKAMKEAENSAPPRPKGP